MKTKAILLAGILSAVGVASSFAQVYSVNAVGYVSVTLAPSEFKLVCNPLNVITNGVQNNTLDSILPSAPRNTRVYKFSYATQSFGSIFDKQTAGWNPNTGVFNPGEGFFVQNRNSTNVTLTFVGEVPQSSSASISASPGFNLVASHFPLTGLVETDLKLPAKTGDKVYAYRAGAYQLFTRLGSSWQSGNQPSISVGEGFFWQVSGTTNRSWTNSFSTSI